jgi:hypothetical protein
MPKHCQWSDGVATEGRGSRLQGSYFYEKGATHDSAADNWTRIASTIQLSEGNSDAPSGLVTGGFFLEGYYIQYNWLRT